MYGACTPLELASEEDPFHQLHTLQPGVSASYSKIKKSDDLSLLPHTAYATFPLDYQSKNGS